MQRLLAALQFRGFSKNWLGEIIGCNLHDEHIEIGTILSFVIFCGGNLRQSPRDGAANAWHIWPCSSALAARALRATVRRPRTTPCPPITGRPPHQLPVSLRHRRRL